MVYDQRPRGAAVERPDPEQVLELGVDAELDARILEIAQATPGDAFADVAPLHAITTATVERVGAEAVRYRPNLVIATPPGYPAYAENEWIATALTVGEARLRALGPTPRCAVPTLQHGPLPRAPHSIRTSAAENRVEAPGFGVLPRAGVTCRCWLRVLSTPATRSPWTNREPRLLAVNRHYGSHRRARKGHQ